MSNEEILQQFDESHPLFESLCLKVKQVIVDLLDDKNYNIHQITHRIKDRTRLEDKILRKENKYKSLNDITDIAGIRIITYFSDDVDSISAIIRKEFKIDEKNSIDKRNLDSDRFGYMSLHYIIGLTNERLRLTENKKFKNYKIELQIRSLLQHGWAEIEHDIGYKGSINLPKPAKRNFHRVAALLETADLEFIRLRDTLAKYETSVKKSISKASDNVNLDLDKASLKIAITDNDEILRLDNEISRILDLPMAPDDYINLDDNLEKLKSKNITTLNGLIDILLKNESKIMDIAKRRAEEIKKNNKRPEGVVQGISIYYLPE